MKSFAITGHVLVLGGSSEIGAACAEMFALHGAKAITLTYSGNESVASALAEKLRNTYDIKTHIIKIQFPLADEDVSIFAEQLEHVVAESGMEIEAMLNAIGVSPNLDFTSQTISGKEGWERVMAINLTSAMFALRVVAERMKSKQIKGAIIQIASTNGINSYAQFSMHYDASKAALINATKNAADHYGKFNIRINAVSPGWISTKINATVPTDEMEKELVRIPSQRLGSVEEVAHIAVSLAENTYMVGANIMIDAGYRG